MLVDGRTIPDNTTIDVDVCVVGAGVAGITLAHEFVSAGFQVALLESGGFEPDTELQSLNCGENIGLPYYPLDTTRVRAFGGTSHRWHVELGENRLGVRLRALDEIDTAGE
jgi:glycine/D-amino acid oxidase-like deaminating enzyme